MEDKTGGCSVTTEDNENAANVCGHTKTNRISSCVEPSIARLSFTDFADMILVLKQKHS